MSNVVASLSAVIGADVSGLDAGLASAENKLQGFGTSMKNMGASVMGAGAQITALTAPIGLAFGVGISTAMDFQNVMAEIEARTGATSDEMQTLSDYALQMGADTAFSGQEAADALLQLLTSGSSVEEAMAILPSVLDAAAASGADLGATADTVTDIMAAFGLGAEDAGSVVDSLARAAGSSSADMESLGQGFGNVAGVANMFGMDVNETAAALAILSENGIKGAEAGTALKSMLTNMARPTQEVQGLWKELGLSMFDTEGNMRDMPTVLDELKFALEDLPAEEQNRIMTQLAGTYGVTALNALLGATSIEEMEDSMSNAASASDVADARLNTFSGSVDSLKGSFETLMITALTPFMDNFLTPMVQDLTDVVNAVTDWVNENPELASQIIAIAAGAVVAGPAIIALGSVISGLGSVLTLATSKLGMLGIVLGVVALTDTEAFTDGLEAMGDAIDKIEAGEDVEQGLRDLANAAGATVEATFLDDIVDAIFDATEAVTGLELPSVSEGFAAWGDAFVMAWTVLQVVVDNVKRGIDAFALDVQIQVVGFVASMRNTIMDLTGIDIAPSVNLELELLEKEALQMEISDLAREALMQMNGVGEIDLNQMITGVSDSTGQGIGFNLAQHIFSDPESLGQQGKLIIEGALRNAIDNVDLDIVEVFDTSTGEAFNIPEIKLLSDAADILGIDTSDIEAEIDTMISAAEIKAKPRTDTYDATPVAEDIALATITAIEAQTIDASINANINVTPSVSMPGDWWSNAIAATTGGMGGGVTVNNYTTNVAGSMLGSEEAAQVVANGNSNGPQ